jgi:hypothetical protein
VCGSRKRCPRTITGRRADGRSGGRAVSKPVMLNEVKEPQPPSA